ncbi:hypothetical protein [Streptomyces sp. NPDC002952]|uniref:hypothetical protein n=1 Tax=Streptomyces sp. NPDC002952 TaxID=3364673 RepID=UPI0036AFC225
MKRRARLLHLPALAAGVAAGAVTPAQARPGAPTTSIVSMGDSYISGEGGRWAGNSMGTGLAYKNGSSDPARVYSWTADNGCHRSNKAEILTNTIAVNDKQNIACSGAKSENIWRASHGG